MSSKLTVHFYLPDATRTACKLPIRGVELISRIPDQTECPDCIETAIWEEAAAKAMERALQGNPWPKNLKPNADWSVMYTGQFSAPENQFIPSKYLSHSRLLEVPQNTPAVGSSSPEEPLGALPSLKPQKARAT